MDEERPLRELDQLVTFYEEIGVSDLLGVQLILSVPIEVKSRRGVQLFGLEVSDQEIPPGALPISGELAGSDFVRQHIATKLPAHMAGQRIRRVTALKFKDDGSPHSVFDENLLYNSSASLFDFIVESASGYGSSATVPALEEAGILQDFEEYLRVNRYLAEMVARMWARAVPHETVRSYVEAVTGGRRVYRVLDIYCPIVCIDGPMHRVETDGFGAVAGFADCESLTTSVRIAGWRSGRGTAFSMRGAEAVTSVMTPAGLEAVLTDLLDYFAAAKGEFALLDSEQAERAVFENDFVAAVREQYVARESYRSDLDFGEL